MVMGWFKEDGQKIVATWTVLVTNSQEYSVNVVKNLRTLMEDGDTEGLSKADPALFNIDTLSDYSGVRQVGWDVHELPFVHRGKGSSTIITGKRAIQV